MERERKEEEERYLSFMSLFGREFQYPLKILKEHEKSERRTTDSP